MLLLFPGLIFVLVTLVQNVTENRIDTESIILIKLIFMCTPIRFFQAMDGQVYQPFNFDVLQYEMILFIFYNIIVTTL